MYYNNNMQYAYVQQYNQYSYINPFDCTNEYRYRSRMVYECKYRVGDFDGYRYYYRYDPTIDARFYECYNLTTGVVYAFNLQTGNWDVIYTPAPVVTPVYYDTETSSLNADLEVLWNLCDKLYDTIGDATEEEQRVTIEKLEKLYNWFPDAEPEDVDTNTYNVQFDYVPEGFSAESIQDVQTAVQNVSNCTRPQRIIYSQPQMPMPQYLDPHKYPTVNNCAINQYNDAVKKFYDEINNFKSYYFQNASFDESESYVIYDVYGQPLCTTENLLHINPGNSGEYNSLSARPETSYSDFINELNTCPHLMGGTRLYGIYVYDNFKNIIGFRIVPWTRYLRDAVTKLNDAFMKTLGFIPEKLMMN